MLIYVVSPVKVVVIVTSVPLAQNVSTSCLFPPANTDVT